MSNAGWYPDPGGAAGMFRYWDGVGWSATLSSSPYAAPPGTAAPSAPSSPPGPATSAPSSSPGAAPFSPAAPFVTRGRPAGARPAGARASDFAKTSRGIGWWLLIGVVVLAMIVGGYTLLRNAGIGPFGNEPTNSNPTTNVCPRRQVDPSAPTDIVRTADGRIQGGKLSYPELGSPWDSPRPDDRVPFGRGTATQAVMIEPDYDGEGASWVASVLVGELVAGDGFFSPEQGSEIVSRCVLGVFYGDAAVQRRDVVNRATTVGGKDAWLVEMHLSFDIPGLQEKGETAIILIVATGIESSSLYYASIPDSRPELLQTARRVQSQLRVES